MKRRHLLHNLAGGMLGVALPALAQTSGSPPTEEATWRRLGEAHVVLFRHAIAPGTGDPPGFRLTDCASQRNLDDAGREQARRIGRAFTTRGVRVGAVWTSPWCRVKDTADLAFPGRAVVQTAFGSFFGERESEPRHTREARAALNAWRGPGLLVVFTHQVNITALTEVFPASGEGIALVREGETFRVLGRLNP